MNSYIIAKINKYIAGTDQYIAKERHKTVLDFHRLLCYLSSIAYAFKYHLHWTIIMFISNLYYFNHREKDRSWTYIYIYIYINKGFNFNMNVIHRAPTKKSLSKSFFGLQPSGFRLSQAETFFYWSHSNFLQYNNPLIQFFSENSLNLRKSVRATRVRSLVSLE